MDFFCLFVHLFAFLNKKRKVTWQGGGKDPIIWTSHTPKFSLLVTNYTPYLLRGSHMLL